MKKSKLKKMLSLILVCAMCMSILAGCGEEKQQQGKNDSESESVSKAQTEATEEGKELEPVTLKWYLDATELEGSADVEEAFNALLAEVLPNTKVEFTYVESYADNWPMFMSGGESMDIAWAGWSTPFLQDVMDGNLLPLTDLIEEYAPNLQNEWATWQASYNSAVYEDEIYGIPGIQPIVPESQWFSVGGNFYEYLDNDAFAEELRSSKKLTSKLLDIIEAGIEAAIADGKFEVGNFGCMSGLAYATRGYMMLGSSTYNMWYDPEAENPVPMHMWELPEVQLLIERYVEWTDKGWYTESQLLNQMPEGVFEVVGYYSDWVANWANADERGYELIPTDRFEDYYKVRAAAPGEGYVGPTNFGSESTYLVIPYTAENPERAIMLIDLLRDEVGTIGNELINMLCYGFAKDSEEAEKYGWFNYAVGESEDGQMMVDTTARGDAASKHGLYNWAIGNTFKTMHDGSILTTAAAKEYALNYYETLYPTLKVTPLAGMLVDFSGLANEFGNVESVFAEYENQMNYAVGGMELYEEVMKKMNDAGLDKIREELQSQIDAYIAN